MVIILWLSSLVLSLYVFDSWESRGQSGDSFGVINSLFSGLAFSGIIYTIILQRKELNLQRIELIATRKAVQESAKAQQKSEKALKKQAANLKVSAKLNAYSLMIDNINRSLDSNAYTGHLGGDLHIEKEKYLQEIRRILDVKNQ